MEYVPHRQHCSIPSQDLQNNILITNQTPPQACLADFGLSTFAPNSQGETTTTTGGTPLYMAPELLCPTEFGMQSARPTQPADIYAFGMVIYEVLTGSLPFCEQNWTVSELTYHVVCGAMPAKPDNAKQIGFGGGTWKLVEECWSREPTARPTIKRALAHLTHVAASSAEVGPTPERPHERADNSLEFDPSSKHSVISTSDNSHPEVQDQILLFGPTATATRDRTVTVVDALNQVDPVNTVSTANTANTLVSKVSSVTSVPSGDSHRSGSYFLALVPHPPQLTLKKPS